MADDKMREALERAERKLAAYVGVCKGDKELTDVVLPMVRAALAEQPAQGDPELGGLMESDFTTALEAQAWRSGFKAGNMKQPAQAEPVRAGTVRHTVDDGASTTQVIWIGDKPRPGTAVYLTPPAPSVPAQGEAAAAGPRFTYGHCADRRQVGGCIRHNLHCGYPDCDRKEVPRG